MMKRLVLPLLLVLVLLTPLSVFAAINAPDSGPFIMRADVYRHVLEDDDTLVVARYQNPYTNVPNETISQAYLARYMNGSTELAAVTPYSYYNRGYGYGNFSMYLDATSAPTWGGSYSVELKGSPTLEWLGTTAGIAITGAVADDGGSQTDETTAANNATVNDMTLLPVTPATNDAYYFGCSTAFSLLTLNIGTQGAGVWTIAWEYYDGDGWESIPTYNDNTLGFTATAGNHDVSFTPPEDWTATTVQSITAYWIRARVSAYTSVTTQPLGTQVWVNGSGTPPGVTTSSLSWRATSSISATQALMYSHLIQWAQTLGDYWNIALTTETASGTILSSYGEAYFTNAIPGLRSMCPELFSAALVTPAYVDVDWQKAQSEVIKATWPFDWSGIAGWFGISSDEVFRTLIFFGIMFILAGFMRVQGGTAVTNISVLAFYATIVGASATGWISPIWAAILAFTSLLVFALVFIWNRGAT